ncbi:M16 family metallopeptidase [Candidatus Omnitrophota bacterium]
MYKKINLNNGVRIVLNHIPRMESAAIGIWIGVGSRIESERSSGISHFLEHMIFKGTPTRSCRSIKEEIEGRGGSLNGFTSEEVTCYLAKVGRRHTDVALDVLSDMVLNAHIPEKDIERERTVIVEEIKMYRDLPNHYVQDMLSELMWPGHALGLSVAGNIESVSGVTRQNLLEYKKINYAPKNIVVALCGNLNHDALIRKIKKIFCVNPKNKAVFFTGFNNTQSRPRIKILYRDTEQTRLSMGVHTFGRMHEDRYVLSLLHIILGANMSSRLFENVREKRGLAYEIGTGVKRYQGTGGFIVNAGIDHKKAKETVALIIKELSKIKDKLVPEKELKRAKEFLKVQLLLALEDTLERMLWLGEHVVSSGKLPDKNNIIRRANSVSSRDLQRVARAIFNSKDLNLAIIGPLKDKQKEELEKELSL